jgi:L-rhamnose mutarotase
MKLFPGMLENYKERHDNLWPELHDLLKDNGISEYSIFFDEETNILFAFQKQTGKKGSQDLGQNMIVKEWWESLVGMMETNPDSSPVTKILEEVFYME